jgi:RNA polymerase sigma factor (TIGR02999 family)
MPSHIRNQLTLLHHVIQEAEVTLRQFGEIHTFLQARLPSRMTSRRAGPMDVTVLLEEARSGNKEALQRLVPLVYNELRRIASRNLRAAGPGQTMLTTDLVHETYLKLIGSRSLSWQNRLHFFSIAATSMRQILVDHARARQAHKRGGKSIRIPLEDCLQTNDSSVEDIAALDEALGALEKTDARSARIVEFRFFGGLTNEEIAELLSISARTVIRDWEFARAWLYRFLNQKRGD